MELFQVNCAFIKQGFELLIQHLERSVDDMKIQIDRLNRAQSRARCALLGSSEEAKAKM